MSALASAPAGRVVIAFTDVQGSTDLWEACPEAMREALATHEEALRRALALHGGYEVKTEGDAFMVAFAEAEGAARWALALQRALLEAPWPEALLAEPGAAEERVAGQLLERGLKVRVGIHLGDPVCRPDPLTGRMDYFGPVVNRASRVCHAGHGGQILLSEAARRALPAALEARLRDLGTHPLKGLREPEHLWQLDPEGLEGRVFPALRAGGALILPPLPAPAGPLLDRDPLLGELLDLLLRPELRALTLTGPAGVGKSRLVHELAWRTRERWPGGVLWCALGGQQEPDAATRALARLLGVPPGRDAARQLEEALAARGRALLVLDDPDGAMGETGAAAGRWLAAAPELALLCAGRSPLGVAGERVRTVGPLPLPAARARPEEIARNPAVQLLLSRARDAGAELELSEENAADLAALAVALDGLPLALELASTRLRMLPPGALLARLVSPGRGVNPALLVDRRRPERQGTLAAAIDLSWEGLGRWEQAAFAQLGVFEGPFDLEDARAVLALSAKAPPVEDLLAELVDRSLVSRAEDGRFRLLSTLRGFALEYLVQAEPVEQRHDAWYARLGDADVLDALAGREGTARLQAVLGSREDLLAAANRAIQREDAAVAGRATLAMAAALQAQGPVEATLPLVERALALEHGPWTAAALRYVRAGALRQLGRVPETELACTEALALAEAGGHADLVEIILLLRATARRLLGRAEQALADLDEALARGPAPSRRARLELTRLDVERELGHRVLPGYERLMVLAERLGEPGLRSVVANNLGVALLERSRLREARRAFEVALVAAEEGRVAFREEIALCNLGHVSRLLGEHDRARALLEQAIELARVSGDLPHQSVARAYLALVELDDGHPELAREALAQALASAEESANPRLQGNLRGQLALCALDLGERAEARAELERALALHRRTTNRRWEVWTLCVLAHLALGEEDPARAEALLAEAAAAAEGGAPWVEGVLGVARARLGVIRGEGDALARAEEALLHLSQERGDPGERFFGLVVLSDAARAAGDEAAASAARAEARALLERHKLRRPAMFAALEARA